MKHPSVQAFTEKKEQNSSLLAGAKTFLLKNSQNSPIVHHYMEGEGHRLSRPLQTCKCHPLTQRYKNLYSNIKKVVTDVGVCCAFNRHPALNEDSTYSQLLQQMQVVILQK